MTKICLRCSTPKSLDDFNKWKLSKDGRQGWCRVCVKEDRDSKKDHYIQTHARYYQNNKEKFELSSKAWAKKNPEKRRQISQRWRENHREQARACSLAAYYKYYERDKDKYIARAKNRRALIRNAPGNVTTTEWKARLLEYNNHCAYCLKSCDKLTQDHMQPLSRGGAHSIENIIPACINCNSQKQKRTFLEYQAILQGLPLQLSQ